ncbi:MAG: hypothetical protein J7501_02250 [Bdellovibrio sp.]|nr:hypothetical protein [Bdellovibrio sp.]
MKTIKIVSALFLSSALLTTACTPRDVKVVKDDVRAKILEKKNRGKGGSFNDTEFKLGSYAMSAFLMEKQVEAIEFVRLAMGEADAKTTQYQVEQVEKDGATSVEIKSSADELVYATDLGSIKGKMNKTLSAASDANGTLTIKGSGLRSMSDVQDKKKFFSNLTNEAYELSAKLGESTQETVTLTVKSNATAEGAKGEKSKFMRLNIVTDLTIVVDKASLATSDVKIVSVEGKSVYQGNNGRDFTTTISGKNLTLKANGLCNELNGSAAMTSEKFPKSVTFAGEQITIGDKWKNKLATCGKRPTVDISRLLTY